MIKLTGYRMLLLAGLLPAAVNAQTSEVSGSVRPVDWEAPAWLQGGNNPWAAERISNTADDLSTQLDMAAKEASPYLVWVNIPSFTLRVLDVRTGAELLRSRVIVGAAHTRTPVFRTRIVNLKFNPDWSPPPSIRARYTPPGPNNPLGQVRFSTDNASNIYLHDTNARHLFQRDQRALSHGCVRVEKWQELSALLSGLSPEQVDLKVEGNRINYLDTVDVPVWISYQRLDLDEDGALALHPDVYRMQDAPAGFTLERPDQDPPPAQDAGPQSVPLPEFVEPDTEG